MVSRIALIVGCLAAATILTIGIVAAAFSPRPAVAAGEDPSVALVASEGGPDASPLTQVQTETVYVRPAPPAEVIRVTRHVRDGSGNRERVVVVHRSGSNSGGGEDEDEDEERDEHEDHEDHDGHETDEHEDEDH